MTQPTPTLEELAAQVATLRTEVDQLKVQAGSLSNRLTTINTTVTKLMDRYKRWQQQLGGRRAPVAERLDELADRLAEIENGGTP